MRARDGDVPAAVVIFCALVVEARRRTDAKVLRRRGSCIVITSYEVWVQPEDVKRW